MFDTSHPWFRPLWRRVALVLVAGVWGLVELFTGSPGWALLFLALAAWVAWALLLVYDPGETAQDTEEDGPP